MICTSALPTLWACIVTLGGRVSTFSFEDCSHSAHEPSSCGLGISGKKALGCWYMAGTVSRRPCHRYCAKYCQCYPYFTCVQEQLSSHVRCTYSDIHVGYEKGINNSIELRHTSANLSASGRYGRIVRCSSQEASINSRGSWRDQSARAGCFAGSLRVLW